MGQPIPEFKCPLDCIAGVGEVFSGQYDFPAQIAGPCRVLDIGANCGAYALWIRRRLPKCQVTCFEPHPQLFHEYLTPNTQHDPMITRAEYAVGDPLFHTLRPGKDTRLCCSFYDLGRQEKPSIPVKVLRPAELEPADIVKIDTEGCEAAIVEQMKFVPALLVVEYHSEALRRRVETALDGKMTLIGAQVNGIGWGHLQFAKGAE